MADNAILRKNLPGGALQKSGVDNEPSPASEDIEAGKIIELNYNSSAGQFEVRLAETSLPGLRVARGGFEEGLDQVYADGDLVRWYVLHSGEEGICYVYGEADGAASAISVGDVLYKTPVGDHTTAHEGMLDVNSVDGEPVAIALEDVASDTGALTKILKL